MNFLLLRGGIKTHWNWHADLPSFKHMSATELEQSYCNGCNANGIHLRYKKGKKKFIHLTNTCPGLRDTELISFLMLGKAAHLEDSSV